MPVTIANSHLFSVRISLIGEGIFFGMVEMAMKPDQGIFFYLDNRVITYLNSYEWNVDQKRNTKLTIARKKDHHLVRRLKTGKKNPGDRLINSTQICWLIVRSFNFTWLSICNFVLKITRAASNFIIYVLVYLSLWAALKTDKMALFVWCRSSSFQKM